MSHEMMLGFWLLSMSLIIVPGQDWAFMIPAGIKQAILPALSGIVLGYCVMTLVVATGVGLTLTHYPLLLLALTLSGAVYLAWLGIAMLRNPAIVQAEERKISGCRQWIAKGMLVSGLNVKALLLFLALLPQFLDNRGSWSLSMQMLVLGMIFTASCAVFYFFVGLGSKAILTSRPMLAQWVSRCSGVLLIGIAGSLLVEQYLLL